MKKMLALLLVVTLLLIACTKDEKTMAPTAGRSLWPQNPMPPQVSIQYPLKKWETVNGCAGWIYPEVKYDTVQMKFTIAPGRTWWGGPAKLSKYRIVVDNNSVKEETISNGTKFPMTYVINVPDKSLWNTSLLNDTINKKWHSVAVIGWQDDNVTGSDATYFYLKP